MPFTLLFTVFEAGDGNLDEDATFSRIPIDSVQFPPQRATVDANNPSSGTVSISRAVDGNTVRLHAAAARNDYFSRAVVSFTDSKSSMGPTIEMLDGSFVNYQFQNVPGGQNSKETITLGFAKWTYNTQPMNTGASDSGSPVYLGWNAQQTE